MSPSPGHDGRQRRKVWNSNARTANIGNTTGKEAISAIVGDTPRVLVNMVIGRKRDKTIGAVSLSALLPNSIARGTPVGGNVGGAC